MELVLDRVTKQYSNKIAVDRLSTTLRPGVIGLLGANGAGKTTLMRMICGILNSTSGSISLKTERNVLREKISKFWKQKILTKKIKIF